MDSMLDRIASLVRLTENLAMVEDSKAVVRVMTMVLWGGIVQVLLSMAVFVYFDEVEAAWVV